MDTNQKYDDSTSVSSNLFSELGSDFLADENDLVNNIL
jgi:hypothetical protein